MPKIIDLINFWKRQSVADPTSSYYTLENAYEGEFSEFPKELHPLLKQELTAQGISLFFKHQRTAWDNIAHRHNIILTTPTASGKTLAYLLPILQALITHSKNTALLLFPTKALAQDQYKLIQSYLAHINAALPASAQLTAGIYDGDTPQHQRRKIRGNVNILLTNPDMLHLGILPNHTAWKTFIESLAFVVVDEIHIYRGIFGSHVANIFRRLDRISKFYYANPLFIGTSATIANPIDFSNKLFGKPVHLISENAAPRGAKHFLFCNPPIHNEELNLRESASSFSLRILPDFITFHKQTLVFLKSRRAVEILTRKISDHGQVAATDIASYRSGYKPQERREIERKIKAGQAKLIFATNALELGIDIGGLDAVLLVGYPGTISSTLQQFGRSGRKGSESIAIFVASNSALDQFIVRNPQFLLETSTEYANINPNNLLILMEHIRCAAFELPFEDGEHFGDTDIHLLNEFLSMLVDTRVLHHNQNRYFWVGNQYPAENVSIRSISNGPYELYMNSNGQSIWVGEVDEQSAFSMVHPSAIYFHMGETYEVKQLDIEHKRAILTPINVDYYTMPKGTIEITILQNLNIENIHQATRYMAEIEVYSEINGYKCIELETQIVRAEYPLDLPSNTIQTRAYFIQFNEELVSKLADEGLWNNTPNNYGSFWATTRQSVLERDQFTCQVCLSTNTGHHVHHKKPFKTFYSLSEANHPDNLVTLCDRCHMIAEQKVKVQSILHGTAHLLHALAPLIAMCDAKDLEYSLDAMDKLYSPYVMIYERSPGGIGLVDILYEQCDQLIQMAFDTISTCTCINGCPACVGPVNEFGTGSKKAVKQLLHYLIA
ncbi:MAG: DEAD/DEAH box helicase [Anaerolineaceae bacterium]|nr:DEAD/DEAH box helicase [Anaerolineaceae bacterium]